MWIGGRVSTMIRVKSDGEVTQGLMEQLSSSDGGYGVCLYCKAKELQTRCNGLYTGTLLGFVWARTKRPQ